MKTNIIIAVFFTTILLSVCLPVHMAMAQSYTSAAAGTWTIASNWNNTSGWGTSTPPIDGSHGSGTITLNHNMTINSAYTIGSATLNISSGKTLTVKGAMKLNGGSTVNVSGILIIEGDLTLNSTFNILPGGMVNVNGKVIVNDSNYLIVGTNAAGPAYADLVVKNDIQQKNSGDITLNQNARVAVFGGVKGDNSGGTTLTLNQGAQLYVDNKIDYKGGSDAIVNNNAVSPYGLYVSGNVTNTGGGAATTSNKADKATMNATNVSFANWVNTANGTLMPVSLLFFEVSDVNQGGIVLEWATASEENFDYFIVESSTDGISFNEIGRVRGHGTTKDRHDYTFNVIDPVVGKSYYKLKSVDFDNYTEAFKVISATYESAKSVKIFPNPVVDGNLNVDFNFEPSERVSISLTNLSGSVVFTHSVNGMENLLQVSVDPGTYIIKISSSEVNSVARIVIK